ncbi:MAG: CPBP family glutamic-type intramembrane protease [Candidatus Hodarchaeales archaeon]
MSETLVENKFPWQFFALAYAITWLFWIPLIVFKELAPIGFPMMVMGAFGPTFAAIILSYQKDGIESVKQLLKRGLEFRIGKKWYIPVLLLNPVIIFVGFGATMVISGQPEVLFDFTLLGTAIITFIVMLPIMLPGGPINEEFGWRGYALDRLQTKWNALVSSLILGVIWALWHLPLFFVEGMSQNILLVYVPIAALLFFVQVPTFTILYTWLHNNTGGSILVAILFHLTWNAAFNVLMILSFMQFDLTDPAQVPTLDTATLNSLGNLITNANIVISVALIIVALAVVLKWGVSLKSETGSS